VTHKLSEPKNQDCRPHPRGSVRRASGFVLTGKLEVVLGPTVALSEVEEGAEGAKPTTPDRRPRALSALCLWDHHCFSWS